MAKDGPNLDELGLSDEELGLGGSGPGAGRGRGAGGRRGGRRGLLLFLLGAAVGVAGALLAPRFLGPHLPAGIGGGGETVDGRVVGKRLDGERLLLTVTTPRGAVLATFRQRVAEIDLLIEVGDSVSLGLGGYRPFADDPTVAGVRKAAAGELPAGSPPVGPAPTSGGDRGGSGPEGEADSGEDVERDRRPAGEEAMETPAGRDTTGPAARAGAAGGERTGGGRDFRS